MNSQDLERLVIGYMLDAPHVVMPIVERRLDVHDFTPRRNQMLFSLVRQAWRKGVFDRDDMTQTASGPRATWGPEGFRLTVAHAVCYYFADDGRKPEWGWLDSCRMPYPSEEDTLPAGVRFGSWERIVLEDIEQLCTVLAEITFRRVFSERVPAILEAAACEEKPREAVRELLVSVREAARRLPRKRRSRRRVVDGPPPAPPVYARTML